MPIKLGFFSDATNLFQFRDLVRINPVEGSNYESARAGRGALLSNLQTEKAQINLEFDRLSQTNLELLNRVMKNRVNSHKAYFHHPNNSAQDSNFAISPDENIIKFADSNDANLDISGGAEISGSEYTDLTTFTSNIDKTISNDFGYLFFQLDIQAFITNVGQASIRRAGIMFSGARFRDLTLSQDIGYKVEVKNPVTSIWHEVFKQGINTANSQNMFANVRPGTTGDAPPFMLPNTTKFLVSFASVASIFTTPVVPSKAFAAT